MLKLKDVILLSNTLNMLEETVLSTVPFFSAEEFEEAKKSRQAKTTCSLNTLIRLKLIEVSKSKKEDKYCYKVDIALFKRVIKAYCEFYRPEIFDNFKKAKENCEKYSNLIYENNLMGIY